MGPGPTPPPFKVCGKTSIRKEGKSQNEEGRFRTFQRNLGLGLGVVDTAFNPSA